MRRNVSMLPCFVLVAMMLSACATMETTQKPYKFSQRGTIIWNDEFEFKLPPSQ